MGTPAFMAPEQLSGGKIDRRTDVYAMGCLAYELLTGHRLFRATNFFELVRAKLTMRLPAAEAIGSGISTELHAFLQAALRADTDERPSSLAPLVEWAATCDPPPDEAFEDQAPMPSGFGVPAPGVSPLLPNGRLIAILSRM